MRVFTRANSLSALTLLYTPEAHVSPMTLRRLPVSEKTSIDAQHSGSPSFNQVLQTYIDNFLILHNNLSTSLLSVTGDYHHPVELPASPVEITCLLKKFRDRPQAKTAFLTVYYASLHLFSSKHLVNYLRLVCSSNTFSKLGRTRMSICFQNQKDGARSANYYRPVLDHSYLLVIQRHFGRRNMFNYDVQSFTSTLS